MDSDFCCSLCNIDLHNQVNFMAHVAGKRHKYLINYVAGLPLHSEKSVMVSGLAKTYKTEDVLHYMSLFGKIANSYFPGRQSRVAWFEYEDVKSCQKAKSAKLHVIDNRQVKVSRALSEQRFVPVAGEGNSPTADESGVTIRADASSSTPAASTSSVLPMVRTSDIIPTSSKSGIMPKAEESRVTPAAGTSRVLSEASTLSKSLPAPLSLPPALSKRFDCEVDALMDRLIPIGFMPLYISLCDELTAIMRGIFPQCQLYAFGSTITGLAFVGSDVDIFLQTNVRYTIHPKKINSMVYRQLLKFSYNFQNIVIINGAKIPIVKALHIPTGLSCDISSTNALGVRNSALINFYMSLDYRVKPLLVLLKQWRKLCNLEGCSNYALTMKALFYLQQLEKPLIPSVYQLQSTCKDKEIIDGWECSFNKSRDCLEPIKNTQSLFSLLAGFFNYFATFEYAVDVVCPLLGRTVPRQWFVETELLPVELSRYRNAVAGNATTMLQVEPVKVICVQDPFVLNHNIIRSLNEKTANQLIMCYKHFADFCEKSVLSRSFLEDFLQECIIISRKVSQQDMAQRSYTIYPPGPHQGQQPLAETKDRDAWYAETFRYLTESLEKVYKCILHRVDEGEEGETVAKKPKLNMDSVTFETQQPIYLLCEGTANVFIKRKEARKVAQTLKDGRGLLRSPIEIEAAASDLMLATCDTTLEMPLQFLCGFRPHVSPIVVEVTFKHLTTDSKTFLELCNCVGGGLRKLIKDSHGFFSTYNKAVEFLKKK